MPRWPRSRGDRDRRARARSRSGRPALPCRAASPRRVGAPHPPPRHRWRCPGPARGSLSHRLACGVMPVTSSEAQEAAGPGPLLVIGGAEDKLRKRTILKEFVTASGGADARIALIPTASSLGDEVVEVYDVLFRRLGAGAVIPVRPENREEAHDPDLVKAVDEATGVFMTGGNQLKL